MPMTLSEIRTRIRSILQEPIAARWQDSDINQYVNDGLLDMAILAKRIRTKTIPISSGTDNVAFPTDMLTPANIYWGDSLTIKTELERGEYPLDDTTTGEPTRFYIYDQKIYLRPKPDVARNIYLLYTVRPAVMALDTDTPELSGTENALISYGVFRAFFEDGDPRSQLWEQDYAKEQMKWLTIEREYETNAFQMKAKW